MNRILNKHTSFIFLLFTTLCSFNMVAQVAVTAIKSEYKRSIEDFFGYNTGSTLRQVSWDTPELPGALKQLHANVYRFPAGAYSNWWDWKTGWLKTASQMPPGVTLPGKYIFPYQYDNSLESFKKSIDATGAVPVFLLNMISSTVEEQIAMLYHAKCIGLPVKYVELGKEFYDDDPSVLKVFPTAESFAVEVDTWTKKILEHFPDVKIGFNASYEFDRYTSPYARAKSWNQNIINVLDTVVDFPYSKSCPSLYTFYGSGNGQTGVPLTTHTQIGKMMKQACTILDHMQAVEIPRFAQFPEVWMSEYNLMDGGSGVHGTWAHGLFTTLVSLRFLDEPKISKGMVHNMVGDAVYSSLFFSEDGFCFGTDEGSAFITPLPPDSNCNAYPTGYLEKSAQGNAVSMMAKAIFTSDSAQKINMAGAPFINGTTYPSVFGYRFIDSDLAGNEQVILLNTGNNTISLNIDSLNLNSTYYYDQLFASPFLPVQGNLNVTTNALTSNTIVLHSYSVTRIYKNNAGTIKVWAAVDTICAGHSVSLHARGADSYVWLPADGLNDTTGADVIATPTQTTAYTVTDNFGHSEIVNVFVVPSFSFSITGLPPGKVCQNDSLKLKLDGASKYLWDPKPDFIFTASQDSVLIVPSKSKDYFVYATNGSSYCGEQIINLNVAGEIEINKVHLICEGSTDTLSVIADTAYTYNWTSNQNGWSSTINQPVVSPTDTTVYFLESTEGSCIYRDTVIVNTMQCCTGDISLVNAKTNDLIKSVYALCSACIDSTDEVVVRNYSGNISINGMFEVDKDLHLINCPDISFNHAATVNVKQAISLTLDSNTVFKNCGNAMWNGIVAYDGLTEIRIANGSEIKNAITGLDASIDTKVYLEKAAFTNNHISVNIHDYLKELVCNIAGSTFKCTAVNDMLSPYTNTKTETHLVIKNITGAVVGNTNSTLNNFINSDYGFKCENVQLNIYNSNFDSINTTGKGIALMLNGFNERNDLINIGGTATAQSVLFSNCNTAIDATDHLKLKIQNNTFTNCKTGINAYACSDSVFANNIDILYNTISGSALGVLLNMNTNSRFNINYNTISATADTAYAIAIQDLLSQTKSQPYIKYNNINKCKTGIYLNQAGTKGSVENNFIYVSKAVVGTKTFGIKNNNTDYLNMLSNTIRFDSSVTSVLRTRGIYTENANQSTLSDNHIRGFERGINIYGKTSKPLFLKCNVLYECNQGLTLESKAQIGSQGSASTNAAWQNKWEPSGWYDTTSVPQHYSVFSYSSSGHLSPFYTLAGYPFEILSSGLSGTGSKITGTVINGTGIGCTLLRESNNTVSNDIEIENVQYKPEVNINDFDINNLTQQQVKILKDIAQKCPDRAGEIVYDARTYLSYHFKTVIDYPFACDKHLQEVEANCCYNTDDFKLFPNPARNTIMIGFNTQRKSFTIELFDALGNKVKTVTGKNTMQQSIDVSDLRAGVYTCRVISGNDLVVAVKKVTLLN